MFFSRYLPGPDDMLVLDIAYMIYIKFAEYPNALQIALFLDNMQYVKQVFTSCTDLVKKKQFCYMIARHGMTFELDQEMVANDEDKEALQDIVNNSKLSEGYLTLARDIEVMEAKTPEDIYKAHLLDGRASSGPSVDSARQNLSATFVNAFVNAGFGQDKLMTVPSDSTSGSAGNWLFKNKEHGKTSAVASLGMIQLWDVETGLGHLDKYFHSNDNPVVAGALLGVGIVNCGIKNDCDPVSFFFFFNMGTSVSQFFAIHSHSALFLRHLPFFQVILTMRIHLSELVLLWVSGLHMRVPKMIR
jgi:26S proteasome regulatory subunit N1